MDAQAMNDIGIYNVIAMLDSTKLKSYHSARLLLEFGKQAIKRALESGNVITTELKDALQKISIHSKNVGDDFSNSTYKDWDDLRHWTVQALEEAEPALSKDFWRNMLRSYVQLEKDTRSLIDRIHEETEKGMSALQTVFVVGGLIAVGSVFWSWFKGQDTRPQVNVGLLPSPHVTVTPTHVPHEEYHG